MADPATCVILNSVLGTLWSSYNSLFIQLWKISIFLSLNFISKTTKCLPPLWQLYLPIQMCLLESRVTHIMDCQDMCKIVKQQHATVAPCWEMGCTFWHMISHVMLVHDLSSSLFFAGVCFCIECQARAWGQRVWHWYEFSQQLSGFVIWDRQNTSLSAEACGLSEQTLWKTTTEQQNLCSDMAPFTVRVIHDSQTKLTCAHLWDLWVKRAASHPIISSLSYT